VDFDAVDLAAVDLAAVDLAAVDLAAVDLAGADFLAAVVFDVVDFAAVLFEGADLVVVDFFAAVDFAAVDFAVVFAAVVLPAVVFEAVELAVVDLAVADFEGVAVVFFAAGSLGSFFCPETTALSSAPAENLGIAVFFALTLSPVRGLRTHRASRIRFSNEPNPVIATFSPRATSRVMTSSTDSRACCACLRLPS
jgi:hypothetical protein